MNDYREYSDYIMHYGILGMHWGIRRYQNPDGSLTDAGAKRYTKEINRDDAKYNQSKEDAKMYKRKSEEASEQGKTEKARKFSELSEKHQKNAEKYLEDRNKGIRDVNDSGYNLRSKQVNRLDARYNSYRNYGWMGGAIGGGLAAAAYHFNVGKYRDVEAVIKGEKFILNGRTNGERGGVTVEIDMKNVENKMKKISQQEQQMMEQMTEHQMIMEQHRILDNHMKMLHHMM